MACWPGTTLRAWTVSRMHDTAIQVRPRCSLQMSSSAWHCDCVRILSRESCGAAKTSSAGFKQSSAKMCISDARMNSCVPLVFHRKNPALNTLAAMKLPGRRSKQSPRGASPPGGDAPSQSFVVGHGRTPGRSQVHLENGLGTDGTPPGLSRLAALRVALYLCLRQSENGRKSILARARSVEAGVSKGDGRFRSQCGCE
ncbi:hypothetical protein DESA109040_17985 [Deinococcus saxicola]